MNRCNKILVKVWATWKETVSTPGVYTAQSSWIHFLKNKYIKATTMLSMGTSWFLGFLKLTSNIKCWMLQWHQRQLLCSWFDTVSWVTLLRMIICYSRDNRQSDQNFLIIVHFPHLLQLLSPQDSWIPSGSPMEQTSYIPYNKTKEKVIPHFFFL